MIPREKRIIFIDMDGTLIKTLSGEPFPRCISDFQPLWNTWNTLKDWFNSRNDMETCYIFIVTNQEGVEKGLVVEDYLRVKIDFISKALHEYLDPKELFPNKLVVDYYYSITKDRFRKPNTGMLEVLLSDYELDYINKDEMVMIGDASGSIGDFSGTDKKTAFNFGIDYIDRRTL